jgi:hypothetical protein
MAQFSFDSSTVAPRENSYELLPAGKYVGQVVDTEIIPLKSGNGHALQLTIEILQEGYRGRKVWARLNIRHINPTAEKIAQEQLRDLCEAIGIPRFDDTAELHNKPISVKVKIRKDDTGQYEDKNEVAGFYPASGAVAIPSSSPFPAQPRAAAPAAAAASAAPAGAAVPPWAKKTAA